MYLLVALFFIYSEKVLSLLGPVSRVFKAQFS